MNNMAFSVAICVCQWDNPKNFFEALQSIIKQTIQPNEIVLVVDGPVSESINHVINNFKDHSSFKIIRLSENVGHGNARNCAIKSCSYELVALMDADDICAKNRFEKQLIYFDNNKKTDVVGGNIKEFIDHVECIVGIRKVPQNDKEIKKHIKYRCPFNQMTVMFKKASIEKSGGYIDWYCNEDYYLWIRMYLNGAVFHNLKECLVYVRVGSAMYKRRGGWKYFNSEFNLQKYMLNQKIISLIEFFMNITIRFIVQIAISNTIRGYLYKNLFRKSKVK